MSSVEDTLRDLIDGLSEENYDVIFAQYRFWLDIGSAYTYINVQDQVNDAISRIAQPGSWEGLIHPTTHLLVRFIGDVEADPKISRHVPGLRVQRCASALRSFVSETFSLKAWGGRGRSSFFLTEVNLIARWANLGYVEEEAIRDHILQSLISHQGLYDHQADALFILFKLAGPTFEAYTDPSVFDHCFELLRSHCGSDQVKMELLQVCAPQMAECNHHAEMNF